MNPQSDIVTELQEQLTAKDAEIERLSAIIEELDDHGSAAQRMDHIKLQAAQIQHLKNLLAQAADALLGFPKLIAQLRKASE